MNVRAWNGDPDPEHDPGKASGQPFTYVCRDCRWRGKGYIAAMAHRGDTGHHTDAESLARKLKWSSQMK